MQKIMRLRYYFSTRKLRAVLILSAALLLLFSMHGCTTERLVDCPEGEVLGKDTARLRTSKYRIALKDNAAAALRVFPFALMSAYAYQSGKGCRGHGEDGNAGDPIVTPNGERVSPATYATILKWLVNGYGSSPSFIKGKINGITPPGDCEDDLGTMYNVWEREEGDHTDVVIAFRGTSGFNDYIRGNFWWFLRFIPNQFDRAREAADKIIAAYDEREKLAGRAQPVFFTTGHSLGGGLAQHVLYTHPKRVRQAVVFDPAPVTAYWGATSADQIESCNCSAAGAIPEPESRILRVYHSYEIVAWLRWFHKAVFTPERHIQELRFNYVSGWNPITRHSMRSFVHALYDLMAPTQGQATQGPWYAAKGTDANGVECTAKVLEKQRQACLKPAGDSIWGHCPG